MFKMGCNTSKIHKKIAAMVAAAAIFETHALGEVGEYLEMQMKRTIDDNTEDWPPLSEFTIMKKGSDEILLDTRKMYASIEHRVSVSKVTIGVHADAPEERSKIALIHEHGAPNVGIPARPFISTTWEREKDKVAEIFHEEFIYAMAAKKLIL